MKKSIIIFLVAIGLTSCSSSPTEGAEEDRHFEINFHVEQEKNRGAALTFAIELDSGYYFGSPHSEGHHQRLIFSIENTDHLLLNGELIESPLTWPEHDPISDKHGRFVRNFTTYRQGLIIGSENDFEVTGLVWLEIRPVLQPYEIEFVIAHQSGNLTVEKTGISPSDYPTFWDKKRVDLPSDQTTGPSTE